MKDKVDTRKKLEEYGAPPGGKSLCCALLAVFITAFASLSQTVAADSGDKCEQAKPYIFGQDYQTGDIVKKYQEFYVCINEGLCGTVSSTRYQPGTGHQWESAWNNLDCKNQASNNERAMAQQ